MNKSIVAKNYADNSVLSITVADGFIESVKKEPRWQGELPYVAPGLIDNQVNGAQGIDFSGEKLSVADIITVAKRLWQLGTTCFLPTLITNRFELLERNFKTLAKARKESLVAASVPGYHLEGPYISALDGYRGAHKLEHVRKPDWEEFLKLQEAAEGKILQVSLAPELEGAIPFIEKCRHNGIIVALAHHAARDHQIAAAVEAGAILSTHLGNGCANFIHRRENLLWPQLSDDRLTATLICDGFHLTPEMVKVFYRAKSSDRIILTSDMTLLAGMPPGDYTVKGEKLELAPNGKITFPAQDVLAGASLALLSDVENMIRFSGCSLKEAIDMASRNVAHVYSQQQLGDILPGSRADLILFTFDGHSLTLLETILAGKTVFKK